MQKKLITLAVAAAFSAPVFAADVSVYGIVDGAIAAVSADGQKSDLLAVSGGLSGSRLGITASEGLDGGLTAGILLEYSMDTEKSTTTAGPFGVRREMLTLSGDFGTVATGYLQTAVYDFNAKYDPSYGSAVSPIQSVNKGGAFLLDGAARASQAIAYISPNINGLTVAVNYATGLSDVNNLGTASNATAPKTTAMILSGNYAQGPLSVGGHYAKTSADNAATSTSSELALGASYNLGVATVMGTFASDKIGAGTQVTNKMFSLSGVMPVGKGAAVATFSKNSMAAANTDGSGFMVAYLHNLSKTTTAYAAFETVKNGSAINVYSVVSNALGGTALTNGGSSNLFAVGLRKKF